MTRGSDTRTPLNWAATGNLVLRAIQNKVEQVTRRPQNYHIPHRRKSIGCIDVVTPTSASLEFTCIRPDLASGMVARFPHVLIERTWVV